MHYVRVLRHMGHEVIVLNVAETDRGLNPHGHLVKGYPAYVTLDELITENGMPDIYLYIEPKGLIPRGIESSSIPTACVLSDVHRNLAARKNLAKMFDYVFLYQRNYVKEFSDHDKSAVSWLPYACDTEFFKNLGLQHNIDVAFIGKLHGNKNDRKRIVDTLSQKYCINEQRYYLQEEIPKIYSSAKIVINMPLGDDLNFRFFEALSCGSLLITKRENNGQEELFKEDVHYVAFNDETELLSKIEYYLNNEEERARIASAGYKEIVSKHTLEKRVDVLLKNVQKGPKFSAPVRKMNKGDVLRVYADIYERAGRIEALLRIAAENKSMLNLRIRLLNSAFKSFIRRALLAW